MKKKADWQIALDQVLESTPRVTCAIVHREPPPEGVSGPIVRGWLFERRRNLRGYLALHLYPAR